jgi:sulfite oxidase
MAPAEPNALPFRAKGGIPHFSEEKEGWNGYIEWEKYPEKKKEVHEIMSKYDFPAVGPPETHCSNLAC